MREPMKKSSESSDLRCSADTLYAILCSPEGYREWYGWPRHVPLDSAEPGFEAGARLRFRGDSSPKTVTAVVQGRLLTFSDEICAAGSSQRSAISRSTPTERNPSGKHSRNPQKKRSGARGWRTSLPISSAVIPGRQEDRRSFTAKRRRKRPPGFPAGDC